MQISKIVAEARKRSFTHANVWNWIVNNQCAHSFIWMFFDSVWHSCILNSMPIYFYFCFRSHFIYVTLLVIDLSIFSRHSEILFWKQHQTAKDFHWIFAKLSLLWFYDVRAIITKCDFNIKMSAKHKLFVFVVEFNGEWPILVYSFLIFFLFSPFFFDNNNTNDRNTNDMCSFFALTWNKSFSRIVMKSMRKHRHREFNWFMQSNCWYLFKFSFFIFHLWILAKMFFLFEMLQMLFVASTAQNIFAISWMTYLNSVGKTKKNVGEILWQFLNHLARFCIHNIFNAKHMKFLNDCFEVPI